MKKHLLFSAVFWMAGAVFGQSDPLIKTADELAQGLARQRDIKVAVLAVPYHDNHASEGPFIVSERLTTYLVQSKKIRVLERGHISELLRELHLSETAAIDQKTAKRIGRVLGADVIVTGTMIDVENGKTEVNVRGLFAGSGRVIAASRVVLERTWGNRPLLSEENPSSSSADEIKILARQLKDGLRTKAAVSLAVLNFTYSRGRMSTGSHLVSERLVTHLMREKTPIIERRLIQKILEEKKWWDTGVMDESIKKVGEILGVGAVVVGTLNDDSERRTSVMARVIEVDSSKILAAGSVVMTRVWRDLPRIPRSQAWSPVPGVSFQLPLDMRQEAGLSRYKLSEVNAKPKQKPYYPAPIPFFMNPPLNP